MSERVRIEERPGECRIIVGARRNPVAVTFLLTFVPVWIFATIKIALSAKPSAFLYMWTAGNVVITGLVGCALLWNTIGQECIIIDTDSVTVCQRIFLWSRTITLARQALRDVRIVEKSSQGKGGTFVRRNVAFSAGEKSVILRSQLSASDAIALQKHILRKLSARAEL